MLNKNIIIILLLGVLLLITPVYSKEVTSVVDDKGLLYVYSSGILGTLHTPYGWIIVNDEDYNNIEVNDTIKYDTHKDTFWDYCWDVELVEA